MQSADKLTPGARLGYAALLLGLACIPILGYFDIGIVGRDDINGPPWLALAVGGVFAAAAVAVMAGGQVPWLAEGMGLTILLGFAAVGGWIAFGPGERVCSAGLSMGGLGADAGASGLSCRIPFGIGAVIVGGLLVWAVVTVLQKMLGGPPALARARSVSEMILIVCLAPLLIIAVLLAVIPAALGAVVTRVTRGHWPRNESFLRRQQARFKKRGNSR